LAVCTICWASSLPFSVFYFHRISFTNVLANFLAVPVGTWILFTALLSILVSPIAGWASIYLNNTNWLLAHLFLAIVNGTASFPGQAMNVGSFPWSSEPKIVVLASGRSETLYFCRGSTNGLINPGSASKYRRITEPFLRTEGVNRLSFVNWTKSDQDHAGSAIELGKHFKIGTGLPQIDLSSASPPPGTAGVRTSAGKETFRLDDRDSWGGLKSNDLIQPVLDCELGSFEVLLLNISRRQIERLPSQMVDVVVVPSPRQCSYLELVHRFHPQAILYLQGKPTGIQPSVEPAIPAWFVGDKGAVTLALSKDRLELSSYLGERVTLRSRSR
ncbi:MAG TPA: ComEC/Rec2 family competence protein, partial [Chthoniobacterales bacterium]|nr:ComEC/Rec2 family competence protein [Chthoniobacterales bacterium]